MTERLDRDAVARILSRAQELEANAPVDESVGIEPDALIEAAVEVGIDANAVRDSLALERLAVTVPEHRRFDAIAGPASVVVERDVPLVVADVLDRIEERLASVHRLVCDRRSDASLVARPRTDASARIGRTLASWRGDGRLAGVASLEVEAVPQMVGSTPVHPRSVVRIRADRHDARAVRLGGGATVGLVGAGAGAATVAGGMVVVAPVVALPLMMGGYVLARSGRGHADRLELELERLVTLAARGERPAGLFGRAVQRARRTVG